MAKKKRSKTIASKEKERLSDCCGYPPQNQIIDGLAICSRCKEWADFDTVDFTTEENGV